MARVQLGLKATGNEWLMLARGLNRQTIDERGIRTSHVTDEMPQQAVWNGWRKVMTIE